MSEMRKTLSIYFVLWLIGVATAAGGTLWLGVDGRVPVDIDPDGTVTRSGPAAALWIIPGILTLMYGALPIAGWIDSLRWRGGTIHLSEDAQRGLHRYGRTFRNYMIAFGALAILLQLFALARAGGVVTPLDFDREGAVRVFNIIAGLLFAYAGNVTPKLPYVPNPAMDAARHHRANRFAGWVFTVGGVAYALNGLVAPFALMGPAAGAILAAMILLTVLRYAWALIAYRRQKRWEQHEGLV